MFIFFVNYWPNWRHFHLGLFLASFKQLAIRISMKTSCLLPSNTAHCRFLIFKNGSLFKEMLKLSLLEFSFFITFPPKSHWLVMSVVTIPCGERILRTLHHLRVPHHHMVQRTVSQPTGETHTVSLCLYYRRNLQYSLLMKPFVVSRQTAYFTPERYI